MRGKAIARPPRRTMKGGALSTVMVVAVLMLLGVMAVISLWDADFLLFSRAHHLRVQRASIESAFTVYRHRPTQDSVMVLYDSVPNSRMRISRMSWGLFEVVTVESPDSDVHRSGIFGLQQAFDEDCVLWYRDNDGAVTLAGDTNINGRVCLPAKGAAYGQMQTAFFNGEKLENIDRSAGEMPKINFNFDELFALSDDAISASDSLAVPFYKSECATISEIGNYRAGQIIIIGGKITVPATARLHDVIIVADQILVETGFRGSAQLFARDSVVIAEEAVLECPSGVYSKDYASLDGEINGYLIVDSTGERDALKPVCEMGENATLRGLLYCAGVAELRGKIEGCAVVEQTVYRTRQGYYTDFLYNLRIAPGVVPMPFLLDAPPERRWGKWVR